MDRGAVAVGDIAVHVRADVAQALNGLNRRIEEGIVRG